MKYKSWERIPNKPGQQAKGRERRLTLDLLLLRLEGRARGLSRLLQVKDRCIFFLAVLAQVLMGNAQLVQLPVEPRNLFVPELEGGPRLLERSMFPLKMALCLLPRHELTLEGSSSSSRADCSCWSRASACWCAPCSCRSCSSAEAKEEALSARPVERHLGP
jgi:hypothetical protein